jgi:hypothetical protein
MVNVAHVMVIKQNLAQIAMLLENAIIVMEVAKLSVNDVMV